MLKTINFESAETFSTLFCVLSSFRIRLKEADSGTNTHFSSSAIFFGDICAFCDKCDACGSEADLKKAAENADVCVTDALETEAEEAERKSDRGATHSASFRSVRSASPSF